MATSQIQLNVGGQIFNKSKTYTNIINSEYEIDSTDTFLEIYTSSSTLGTNSLNAIKNFCLYNKSDVPLEVLFTLQDWKNNSNIDEDNSVDVSGSGASNERFVSMIIPAGDFLYMPTGRICGYHTANSAGNAARKTNEVPDADQEIDSTANVDPAGIVGSTSNTTVMVEPWTSAADNTTNLFVVGDLIRVENEIMEVTEIGDKSNLANNKLTVIRGVHGSTAVDTAADGDPIDFPFFNMYEDYDKYTKAQTNMDGKFKAMNFFGGYGRRTKLETTGLVAGSIAIKFYEKAFQGFGLSGITANTHSGLSASTTYYFTLNIDTVGTIEIAFTTDATNLNFGGKNGIVSKIQSVLDSQFYVEANLYEKRVTCGIVGGDVVITSESRLSTSSVAITAGASGSTNTTNLFDGTNPIGRIPASPNTAVKSKLPLDTIKTKVSYIDKVNSSAFMYDDGQGNLIGAGTGTINYTTGEIDFKSFPNAEFVFSMAYHSAHSGGVSHTTDAVNQIKSIKARSCNQKLNSVVQLIAYGE